MRLTSHMEKDFSKFLKGLFAQRKAKNPRYSMRAFAKRLGVDQSLLAKVIKGKRPPSQNLIKNISKDLNLTPDQVEIFLKTKYSDKNISDSTEDHAWIGDNNFDNISDWYYFAILELVLIPRFIARPSTIAKGLDISIDQAKEALSRLLEHGLIIKHGETYKVVTEKITWIPKNKETNEARKKLQKILLEKSKVSIDSVPYDYRENVSYVLAFDSSKVVHVRKMMVKFTNQLAAFGEKNGNYDQVYQMVMGFYPLSQLEKWQ